jgi:hypothetical protein
MPTEDEELPELGEDAEDAEAGAIEAGDDTLPAPEAPADAPADLPAEDTDLVDRDYALAWNSFRAALPWRRRAVLELCARDPARFGWLLGLDERGRLRRLRLDLASGPDWDAAFAALCRVAIQADASGLAPPEQAWRDARAFEESWKADGLEFYLFMSVSLPNLRDGRWWIVEECRRLSRQEGLSALVLAVAEVLSSQPLSFWWLVFGPAREDWPGLFEALKKEASEVCAGLSAAILQERWNAEGRPQALALLTG